ncbi:hypothetical protein RYX36_037112 [Vicia faba]
MMFHRRKKEPNTLPLSNSPQQQSHTPSSPMPSNFTSYFSRFRISTLTSFILLLSLLLNFYFLLILWAPYSTDLTPSAVVSRFSPTTRRHVLFSVASSSLSWQHRQSYVHLWYSAKSTRALAFLDSPPGNSSPLSPPVVISGDASGFPYTLQGGLRSAIRVARVVKEAVDRNETDVRWFVFGDDDTVFFVENVVKTLSKYDHDRWFYVGSNSESYDQNTMYSFEMAFGGGGFAISYSLAKVLARVLDSCLRRYGFLYGSDARIYSCVAELGVTLTHEPGFHQLDMRGNLFGVLAAHPLSPLCSLHHLDAAEPIFPDMNRTQALGHLIAATNVDPARILQQTVCYNRPRSLTFSISWGFAIQVYQGNVLLPDLLAVKKTFAPWRKIHSSFMLDTRDYPKDPCKRPSIFFLKSVASDKRGIQSNYTRHVEKKCPKSNPNLPNKITVYSRKLDRSIEEMKAPRRECCNSMPSSNETISIHIRQCGNNELISMES